ncbi:hypothetical protein N7532_000852 [Penicillium argentinense]|uniref:Zn(2)-C6 fungal-type domain-containing protein n=1 Tax=Penicillium argentinense TaxID=1131581 RepID=A0A9W9G7I1_9EURO|nr:uncharacterized protein N7532_000852 [Penicillium argentinense]KAJ5112807.1 hypothetical protein N7532_000852 [Penicillium argentinense]
MGGIPWKSAGCQTCKTRKIKCDLTRPECTRCIKRGLSCPGYEKTLVFVHQTAVSRQETGHAIRDRSTGRSHAVAMSRPVRAGPEIRTQLFSLFLGGYFPLDRNAPANVDQTHWLFLNSSVLLEKTGGNPDRFGISESALAALSCTYLGRHNRDDRMARYGVQLYKNTLQLLSRVSHQSIPIHDLVCAGFILKILESHYFPHGFDVWASDFQTHNAFLQQSLVKDPNNPLMVVISNQMRKGIIFATTVMRAPKDELQYLIHLGHHKPFDELFELFVNLSGLVASVEETDHSDHEVCQTLLQDCYSQKESIMAWYSSHKEAIGGQPYVNAELKCHHLPPSTHLFGIPYGFNSLDCARFHMFFWMALIIVQSLIYQANILVLSHTHGTFPIDPTSHAEYLLIEFYADEFCRSITFFLQDTVKVWGVMAVVAAMPHIFKPYIHLRRWDKFLWCQKFCCLLLERGLHMAGSIAGAWWKTWSLAEDPVVNSMLSLSLRYGLSREVRRSSNGDTTEVTEVTEEEPIVTELSEIKRASVEDNHLPRRPKDTRAVTEPPSYRKRIYDE